MIRNIFKIQYITHMLRFTSFKYFLSFYYFLHIKWIYVYILKINPICITCT
jgi:hypothetical protein